MDNARIHHGEDILFNAGIRLEFLPPYSPDLNPIEEVFLKIKTWIRHHADLLSHDDGIFYDLLLALKVITADDAQGYICHSDYF